LGLIFISQFHIVDERNFRRGSRISTEMRSIPIVGVTSV